MKSSIGYKSAYPVDADQDGGMTYRQWLIGQIVSGCFNSISPEIHAIRAIQLADAIINRLEEERSNEIFDD